MPFPDSLVQECRVTVALVCRELVFSKKTTGETTAKQKDIIGKAFHGSDEGQYESLTHYMGYRVGFLFDLF